MSRKAFVRQLGREVAKEIVREARKASVKATTIHGAISELFSPERERVSKAIGKPIDKAEHRKNSVDKITGKKQ